MARGKKTGGRDFKKGEGGRQFGAKDRIPRGSVRNILAHLSETAPELYEAAIRKGLRGRQAFHFVQLTAHYIDGKPAETVNIRRYDTSQLTAEEIEVMERVQEKLRPKL